MKLAKIVLALSFSMALSAPANDWNVPHIPFHIIGNIYFVGTAGIGVYLITTPKGNILIDGSIPESAPQIERNVRALGFKVRDIKYLLNTHAHFDHCGGLAALKRDSGATMLASSADKPVLEAGTYGSYGAGWGHSFPPVRVDRIIGDGDRVELGGVALTAMITPGHTKGCTAWLMKTQENGHTYSVIFYGSTSVPGYPLVHNREYPNIVSDYETTFMRLKQVHVDVFLANHTGFFNMDEKLARRKQGGPNPFIDPGELQHYVAQSEADFKKELAEQTRRASLN